MYLQYQNYPELYRVLVEELGGYAIFLVDLEGRMASWNVGVERILGYREEEFLGQPFSMIFTPEDRAAGVPEKERETALREGRAPDIRWHLRKDGSRFYVDGVVTTIRSQTGDLIALSKVMRDVTEQKQAEEERQAQHQRTTEILESISDAFYAVDAQFRFTYVNRKAEEWWGRKREELLGRHIWTEFPRAVGSESYHQHLRAMSERRPLQYETVSPLLEHWIHVNIYPEAGGGLSCYFQDISIRKQAEAEREKLLADLSRSNEELAQFSSVVSHDLQSPLRTVTSYAQLLKKRYWDKLDEAGQGYLHRVLEGAQTMAALIRGLLAHAAEADEKITPVSLESVFEDVMATLQSAIDEAGATVTHDPLPTVAGDPVQFVQLFQNLMGNALKYRRAGVAPAVHVAVAQRNQEWLFAVRDNGLGIEQKDAEHIFLPLKRLHGKEISGTGIGLAICKKIVERRGGRIWVESEVGVGSTFYFTLPRAQTEAQWNPNCNQQIRHYG
jgi:PAS domain S-box-containing protein